jgi:Ca2+-binding RTX toxin-like protein
MGDLRHSRGTCSATLRSLLRLSLTLVACVLPLAVPAATIDGTSGPDTLEGTPDADTINGKGGADEMSGLGGNDTYIVDNVDDVVIEGAGEGKDKIKSMVSYTLPIYVEDLTLLGFSPINGTGNNLRNRIIGNSANNILNGKGGADTMQGMDGNDIYYVDNPDDVVAEQPDQGIDTVRSTVSYKLRIDVENLVLLGTDATNGTGNDGPNTITGNAAANVLVGNGGDDTLNGGDGNDRLIGGPGNDKLTGGAGNDAFQFSAPLDAATNVDNITDFNPAQDEIRLDGLVFTALTTGGTLSASAFALGAASTASTNRILYEPATGALRYDPDGTGASAAVRFATLAPNLAVTNADFVVINPQTPPIGYAAQIQPIFTANCTSCHGSVNPPEGLHLTSQSSYSNLVNVASAEVPSLKRVKPGDPDNSYLVQKLEGTAAVGARMPRGLPPLSADNINLIRGWIEQGANNN